VGSVNTPSECARHVTDLSGAVDILDDTGYSPTPRLSPSGTHIAMTDLERSPSSTTNLYQSSTLVNAIPGYAVGWIDENDLLVQSYKPAACVACLTPAYDHSTIYGIYGIYGIDGSVVASPSLRRSRTSR